MQNQFNIVCLIYNQPTNAIIRCLYSAISREDAVTRQSQGDEVATPPHHTEWWVVAGLQPHASSCNPFPDGEALDVS